MATTTTTTQHPIRYVPNTRQQFRYLNEDELVSGATAWMVDIDNLPREPSDLRFYGKVEVTVDQNPLFDDRQGVRSVYYHCIRPAWEGQCFVPVAHMTTGFTERDERPAPGPRHEYWVPTW